MRLAGWVLIGGFGLWVLAMILAPPSLYREADLRERLARTRFPDGTLQVSTGPDLSPLAEVGQRRLVRGVQRRDPRAIERAG